MNKIHEIFNDIEKTPIWFMRQAGRYLPEYKIVRQTEHNFLDFCYNPKKAAEVTLQPIKRFGFNAAIIFSDILVLPHALGWNIKFEENVGPILHQFKSSEDFKFLKSTETEKLNKVYDAINIVKSNLPTNFPLIGFAGSPWTVVSYMLEGKSKQDFSTSKKFIYENKQIALDLINFITAKTIEHLFGQIKAGCNIIQLFDSWAGMLSGNEYLEFVIKPTSKIVKAIKDNYSNMPIIGFPKGSGYLYEDYINNTGIDIIGVDQFIPVQIMRKWQEKIIVQGNLDPVILLTNKDIIEKKVYEILSNMADNNFIFNLGHGILPATPIENVEFIVNYVQNFRR